MMQVFTDLLKLPIEAFVYSINMLVKTIQGLQKLTEQGIDSVTIGRKNTQTDGADADSGMTGRRFNGSDIEPTAGTTDKEKRDMIDLSSNQKGNLGGKDLKLVRYKVLFVKRGLEVAFPEKEDLIADDLTSEAFTAWKIAEFIQNLKHTERPHRWVEKDYPRYEPEHPKPTDGNIHWLNEEDKKYLRIYYQVLATYPREEGKEQVEVLQEIRDVLDKRLDVLDKRLKPIGS